MGAANSTGHALIEAIESQIVELDPNFVTDADRKTKGKTKPGYHPEIDLTDAGCSPDDLEFYYNEVSANSLKTKVVLAEAGVPFVYKHIELTHDGDFETKRAPFLKINPSGTLPVLVYKGHPVYDSTAQVKFVAEMSPNGLYPPSQKELIDKWVYAGSMEGFFMGEDAKEHIFDNLGTCFPWISIPMFIWDESKRSHGDMAKILFDGRELAAANVLMRFFAMRIYEDATLSVGPKGFANPFVVNNVWANLRKGIEFHLGKMTEQLKASGGQFLLGRSFTLADASMIPFFQRATITGWLDELRGKFPVVERWWDACRNRPAYREWVPKYGGPNAPHMNPKELAQFLKKMRQQHPKFDAVYKGTYAEYEGPPPSPPNPCTAVVAKCMPVCVPKR